MRFVVYLAQRTHPPPASFHGRESACGISLGLPTDVVCLAQRTQRTRRCHVGCRAPINGCRCEMAYGYRTEDAEGTEMSCWLSCADKWLSHFQLQLPPSCFILPTSYLAQRTQRTRRARPTIARAQHAHVPPSSVRASLHGALIVRTLSRPASIHVTARA